MWGVRPPSIDAAWGLVQSPSCLGPVPRVSCQSGHIAPTQSTETQSQTRNAKGASQGFLPCLLLGRDEARGTRPLKPCSICEHSVAWPSAAGPCWRCFKSSVGTAISVVFIRTRCPSSGGRRGHRKSCQGWPTNEHTKPRLALGRSGLRTSDHFEGPESRSSDDRGSCCRRTRSARAGVLHGAWASGGGLLTFQKTPDSYQGQRRAPTLKP
jgi:hypothetical protein